MKHEEITIRQEEYTPLAPYNPLKGQWILIYPSEPFDKEGYAKAVMSILPHKPSFEDIKKHILDYCNQEIDKGILSGFKWRGMSVWLSPENQQNYKASFDLAMQFNGLGGTLPVTFKFGSEAEPIYYKFETLDDLKDFYLSAVQFVTLALEEGWKKKDTINWEIYHKALQDYEQS